MSQIALIIPALPPSHGLCAMDRISESDFTLLGIRCYGTLPLLLTSFEHNALPPSPLPSPNNIGTGPHRRRHGRRQAGGGDSNATGGGGDVSRHPDGNRGREGPPREGHVRGGDETGAAARQHWDWTEKAQSVGVHLEGRAQEDGQRGARHGFR